MKVPRGTNGTFQTIVKELYRKAMLEEPPLNGSIVVPLAGARILSVYCPRKSK